MESIKNIFENAKSQLQAKMDTDIASEIQDNYQSVVLPKFQEIDDKKTILINKLTEKYNTDIAKIEEEAQKGKNDFRMAQEIAIKSRIKQRYDEALQACERQLADICK